MRNSDLNRFAVAWRAAHELVSRPPPTDTAVAMAFKLLARFDVRDVERAIEAHLSDPKHGQFPPRPADIIGRLDSPERDGRPHADEAWATALQAMDESVTVVWTDETAIAWGVASVIAADGDRVGARMAFRAAYERAVQSARDSRKPVRWIPSLGSDVNGRKYALEAAVADGRLTHQSVEAMLPPPEEYSGIAPQIAELTKKITSNPQG